MWAKTFLRRLDPFWPGVSYSGISEIDVKCDRICDMSVDTVKNMFCYSSQDFSDFDQNIKFDHE